MASLHGRTGIAWAAAGERKWSRGAPRHRESVRLDGLACLQSEAMLTHRCHQAARRALACALAASRRGAARTAGAVHISARGLSAVAFAACAVALCGCGDGRGAEDAEALSLSLPSITPPTDVPLELNREIRLVFSRVIEPTSVTADSVRLVDRGTGKLARGEWTVDGRMLRFIPEGVTQRDLKGGGYTPGAALSLVVGGFPRVSAVRSVGGEVLSHPIAATFEVVSADSDAVFLDSSPDETDPLYLRPLDPGAMAMRALEHDGALVVACDEALDPRTLFAEDFEFARVSPAGASPVQPGRPGEPDVVPVQSARFLENGPGREGDGGTGALIQFTPERHFAVEGFPPDEYVLRPRSGSAAGIRLRDFSGGTPDVSRLRFNVARYPDESSEGAETYAFDFLDPDDVAPLADETCDGAAHWAETGRVSVRYPRAAGDGLAEVLSLPDGDFAARDVQATSIGLGPGVECRLAGSGPVVLRAQGKIELEGRLVRRLDEGVEAPPMWEPGDGLPGPGRRVRTLTGWLDEALLREVPWTVIIAGGDVVIRGEIDVDTPLLIVAGGKIRGRRAPKVAGGQLWLLGEGGFDPDARSASAASNPPPPLVIDPPVVNQLRETLTFVAYSAPVPKAEAPREWGMPRITGRDGPHGEVGVTFIGAEIEGRGFDAGQAVRHVEPMGVVRESSGAGAGARVRLRVELVVRPDRGGDWDPPVLDRVLLTWTQDPKR